MSNSNPTIAQIAKAAAEKILGFYPPMTASDPRIFIAGMVELLVSYSIPTINRATNTVHGLPGRFKWLPSIAEIRECCEQWESEEIERAERMKRWKAPALPPSISHFASPKPKATYTGLCRHYGINAIPPGWDAIDVCRAYAQHGSRLQDFIDDAIRNQIGPPRRSVFHRVVEQAQAKMQERDE